MSTPTFAARALFSLDARRLLWRWIAMRKVHALLILVAVAVGCDRAFEKPLFGTGAGGDDFTMVSTTTTGAGGGAVGSSATTGGEMSTATAGGGISSTTVAGTSTSSTSTTASAGGAGGDNSSATAGGDMSSATTSAVVGAGGAGGASSTATAGGDMSSSTTAAVGAGGAPGDSCGGCPLYKTCDELSHTCLGPCFTGVPGGEMYCNPDQPVSVACPQESPPPPVCIFVGTYNPANGVFKLYCCPNG